jgi:hypothetical protein
MKKVIGGIAGLVFALFGFGIIALVMSLTYSGLQRIFPDNPANQMWGLVIFDIAVIAWALAFAFKSYSLGQYAAAGAGFLVGFAGMGLMVYAEVTLSGQQLTGGAANTAEIGQWMIWAFVIGSLIHVALLWMHHAADPDLATQISTGVAQGLIRDKARAAAEHQLEVEAEHLARAITAEAVAKARRDLHVPGGQIIDLPALPMDNSLHVPSNGYPAPVQKRAPSIFSKQYWQERFGKKQDPRQYEQAVDQTVGNDVETANASRHAWFIGPDGSRMRYWCLDCRAESRDWMSSRPCEHILNATATHRASWAEAAQMIDGLVYNQDHADFDSLSQYDHLRPPGGDRQHPDLVFARIPSSEWNFIMSEWRDYDETNAREAQQSMDARSAELENKDPKTIPDAVKMGIKESGAKPSPFRPE